MATPRMPRPKRTTIGCSLPPALAERLNKEADERVLAPSKLIETALGNLFAMFDAEATPKSGPPAA